MIVTFISQCQKKSLSRTRRVLDAFAERIGDNTWQTVITAEGLQAVKKLLRKTATKNTAVSCHRIRSRSTTELLWVVGTKEKFNSRGQVPVNTTRKQRPVTHESNWQYLPLIQSLTAVAALLHDWGKASALFQKKLSPAFKTTEKGDPIRHEWISCLIFAALVRQTDTTTDTGWLQTLAAGKINEDDLKNTLQWPASEAENPFTDLPPIAQCIAWLIVSHHRLPTLKNTSNANTRGTDQLDNLQGEKRETLSSLLMLVSQQWGYANPQQDATRVQSCFDFTQGLLADSKKWLKPLKKWAGRLHAQQAQANEVLQDGSWRVVMHHSRLCLMLGDHFYSSQPAKTNWQTGTTLYANTDSKTKQLKQTLDEHLHGVCEAAIHNVYQLPWFEQLPTTDDISALKKPSSAPFQWQDKAVKEITQWRRKNTHETFGCFVVNMASTGCGKTFANAKVMRALSADQKSLRYTLALGLRTLTLQTGNEYRERIGLDNSDLAVLIGSSAVKELHDEQQAKKQADAQDESLEAMNGSESLEALLDEEIDYDGPLAEEKLTTVLRQERDRQFLYAPVLACTIDHVINATQCIRGGRYILPSLRMMSADLVIDEVDDFTGKDIVAIGRLVFFAGMMGRKVMISSATIPPDFAEGYFKAYRDGWRLFAQSRGLKAHLCSVWIDEFTTQVEETTHTELPEAIKAYRGFHQQFIQQRVAKLNRQAARRRVAIVPTQAIIDAHQHALKNDEHTALSKQTEYFQLMAEQALALHKYHSCIHSGTGIQVSFGVLRVANIKPCVALARYLLEQYECPEHTEIRVMCYHSQQVLLLRSEQEAHLDAVLKRKEDTGQPPEAFANAIIRQHLAHIEQQQPKVKHVLFMLVATPVEEVGRDHDFDWAVLEPSSFRSIIQLAGRVRRHRDGAVTEPNIAVMEHNLKAVNDNASAEQPVFCRPGFESPALRLNSHSLFDLLDSNALAERLDAIPRIQKQPTQTAKYFLSLKQAQSLAELEHAAIWKLLAHYHSDAIGPKTFQGYLREVWWLTGLPQQFFPFRSGDEGINTYLTYLPKKDAFTFCEKDSDGQPLDRQNVLGIEHVTLADAANQRLWLHRDYSSSVAQRAEQSEQSWQAVSLRFGELNFRYQDKKRYWYNDQLGLVVC